MDPILLNTAQRWCVSERKMPLDEAWIPMTKLESAMDQFLDRNLYELPIPRYDTTYDAWNPKDVTVHTINLALQNIMSRLVQSGMPYKHLDSFAETSKIYMNLFPSLEYLRSMDLKPETQAIVLVVLATCPTYFNGIPKKYIFKGEAAFCKTTLEHLESLFKHKAKGPLELLEIADTYITKKELKEALRKLPKGKEHWHFWSSSKDLYNVPDASAKRIDESIQAFSKALNISEAFLLSRCKVKNLIDEDLVFGFT